MKYVICIPREDVFQEIHSSNVPLPIHSKAEDGDPVFRIASGWILSKQCSEILSIRTQMLQELVTGLPQYLKRCIFSSAAFSSSVLVGLGDKDGEKGGEVREFQEFLLPERKACSTDQKNELTEPQHSVSKE